MRTAALAIAELVFLSAGCARPATYWKNRGRDFAQCFTLAAGIGLGLDAEIHVTDWVATGVGASLSAKHGWGASYTMAEYGSGWPCLERHVGFPIRHLAPVCAPRWATPAELPTRAPAVLITAVTCGTERRTASLIFLDLAAFRKGGGWLEAPKAVDRFGIDIGATLLVPSFRVGVNPARFLDFLLGWTTLDIAGNDEAGKSPPPPPAPQTPREDRP